MIKNRKYTPINVYPYHDLSFPLLFKIIKQLRELVPIRANAAITNCPWSAIWNSTFLFEHTTINDTPKPIRVLNSGPAKQPVTAVWLIPSRVIAGFATKSPAEFPQANKVSPKKLTGMSKTTPKSEIASIIYPQIAIIHNIDITNDSATSLSL